MVGQSKPAHTQVLILTYGRRAWADTKNVMSDHTANVQEAIREKKTLKEVQDWFKSLERPADGVSPWAYHSNLDPQFTMDKIISETTSLVCISCNKYMNPYMYPDLDLSLTDVCKTKDMCCCSDEKKLKEVLYFVEDTKKVGAGGSNAFSMSIHRHDKKNILEQLGVIKTQSPVVPNAQLLVHISCHGDVKYGKAGIVLNNGDIITGEDLSKAVRDFKGRVIFIIDTCYSGNIGKAMMGSAIAGTMGQKIREVGRNDGSQAVSKGLVEDAINMYSSCFKPVEHQLSKLVPLKVRSPLLYMAMSMPVLCVMSMVLRYGLELCDINVGRWIVDAVGYSSASLSIVVMLASGGMLMQVGFFWVLAKVVSRCHGGGVFFGAGLASTIMLMQRMFFEYAASAGRNLPYDMQSVALFVEFLPTVVGILCSLYSSQYRASKVSSIVVNVVNFLACIHVDRGMWLLDGGNHVVMVGLKEASSEVWFAYSPLVNNTCTFKDDKRSIDLLAKDNYTRERKNKILTCNMDFAKKFVTNVSDAKYETLKMWKVDDVVKDFRSMVETENSLYYKDLTQESIVSGPDYITNIFHTAINRILYGVDKIGNLLGKEKLGATFFFVCAMPMIMRTFFPVRFQQEAPRR